MAELGSEALIDDAAARVVQELDAPVALVDAASLTILLENARFFQAFASTGDEPETLTQRLPFLEPESYRERLAKGRTVTVEKEVQLGARNRAFAIDLRQIEFGARSAWMVQARDLTKQKEAEYMLDSYS